MKKALNNYQEIAEDAVEVLLNMEEHWLLRVVNKELLAAFLADAFPFFESDDRNGWRL